MFRIRRIQDDLLPQDKESIQQVQNILRSQFSILREKDVQELPEQLKNPVKYRFRAILFVADDHKNKIKGFALLFHFTDLKFCFLDFISAAKYQTGRGIGSALYERVREEAVLLNSTGLFFECLPDDPELCKDPEILKQNKARLKFYENFGARPVINTKYETPVKKGGENPPILVFDDLGSGDPLKCDDAKNIVQAILERRYHFLCSKEYTNMVVASFKDNPVKIRPPKYTSVKVPVLAGNTIPMDSKIYLIVNDKHKVHNVREKGYVESPVRIGSIYKHLEHNALFFRGATKEFPDRYLETVHDREYILYFKKLCEMLKPREAMYPFIFPIRKTAKPPKELPVRVGYYCIDTFTPLSRNAFTAAKWAVNCVLTATQKLTEGSNRIAYALVRPPGHHAEKKSFGGFCYFNSTAIAAQYLSSLGKVAILDLDYHHGNGQQNIFYDRDDVLTVSIHGHPRIAYPYFSGFEDERGAGIGYGYNHNFPLPETITTEKYHSTLSKALKIIKEYDPVFLVVALGLDTAKGDPTGSWALTSKDFRQNGKMISDIRVPTLVVQEGGYNNRLIGINAKSFFEGLWNGTYAF
ncbi:MAG: histone deacetylase family protein [Candidatus Omnitrophota bacterium]|nr:histone deacetylase family protein [Candidatus Omnitrophota bacterium]